MHSAWLFAGQTDLGRKPILCALKHLIKRHFYDCDIENHVEFLL